MENIKSLENISTKEGALNAYKVFVNNGVTDPDELDKNSPDVQEAHRLYNEWKKQEGLKNSENEDAHIRGKIDEAMFFLDAGFTSIRLVEATKNAIKNRIKEEKLFEKTTPNDLEGDITREKARSTLLRLSNLMKKLQAEAEMGNHNNISTKGPELLRPKTSILTKLFGRPPKQSKPEDYLKAKGGSNKEVEQEILLSNHNEAEKMNAKLDKAYKEFSNSTIKLRNALFENSIDGLVAERYERAEEEIIRRVKDEMKFS